jgi:hypothetical protein
MAAHDLLTSQNVYSGNLDDTEAITRAINKVAKIDRLPSSNSPEALAVILAAWDCVDIFNITSSKCKVLAKVSYALLLIGAIVLTTIAVVACNEPQAIGRVDLRRAVVSISLCLTFLTSAITYIDPVSQWQQLRGAALALESEIWKFRTRTGTCKLLHVIPLIGQFTPYQLTSSPNDHLDSLSQKIGGESVRGEEQLRRICESLKSHVLKSASVIDTSFFSQFKILDTNPQ